MAVRGDARTVTGRYIPVGQRDAVLPFAAAWERARDDRPLRPWDTDRDDPAACVNGRDWCPGSESAELPCYDCRTVRKRQERERGRDDEVGDESTATDGERRTFEVHADGREDRTEPETGSD